MSNNSTCSIGVAGMDAASKMTFAFYHVLTFIYLIVGISTKVILLLAFYKQSKTKRAYGYQVVFTVSKAFETFAFGTYLLARKWFLPDDLDWFMTNYSLAQFYAIGLGLHASLIISSLLLALAMSADRVFALMRPMAYRNINHQRHQILACTICFFLGFLGGSMYFADEKIRVDGNRYIPYFDQELEHTVAGQVFFHFRLLIRVGGMILLIILNCLMAVSFHKRMRKVATMTNDQLTEGRTKAAEKMLLWINIYQSCMMLANQLPHVTWKVLMYLLPPDFQSCEGTFIGPICDGVLMITDTVDFFIVIAINRRIRNMVASAVCCCSCKCSG